MGNIHELIRVGNEISRSLTQLGLSHLDAIDESLENQVDLTDSQSWYMQGREVAKLTATLVGLAAGIGGQIPQIAGENGPLNAEMLKTFSIAGPKFVESLADLLAQSPIAKMDILKKIQDNHVSRSQQELQAARTQGNQLYQLLVDVQTKGKGG
jgi:hypothetical protein